MALPKVPEGFDACSIMPKEEHRSKATPWVTITEGGNLFYSVSLEAAVDILQHLGYKVVRQGPAGALYKASASAKLRAVKARLTGESDLTTTVSSSYMKAIAARLEIAAPAAKIKFSKEESALFKKVTTAINADPECRAVRLYVTPSAPTSGYSWIEGAKYLALYLNDPTLPDRYKELDVAKALSKVAAILKSNGFYVVNKKGKTIQDEDEDNKNYESLTSKNSAFNWIFSIDRMSDMGQIYWYVTLRKPK